MRSLIVVMLLVAGCGADAAPTAPYAVSDSREPIDEPLEEPIAEPTPEPKPRTEPAVVAQGFTASTERNSASYAVVVENPNATWVPTFVNVSITFLDEEGTMLTTEAQNITGMLPESETAVAGDAAGAGDATEMEVQISTLNLLPTLVRSSLSEGGHYEYERVETALEGRGGVSTTGAVVSRFDSTQYNVPIHVVYYDDAGEVVGGCLTSVDEVPAGRQVTFEASTSVTVPDIAETRVFGHVGFGN